MNKYLKVASMLLVFIGSCYLPAVNASSSTEMLLTIAETNPILVERLNEIALNDAELLNQLLKMADADSAQLERLLNLIETDIETLERLVNVFNAEVAEEQEISTMKIKDGGIIRN